jgi:hypothetical protein
MTDTRPAIRYSLFAIRFSLFAFRQTFNSRTVLMGRLRRRCFKQARIMCVPECGLVPR